MTHFEFVIVDSPAKVEDQLATLDHPTEATGMSSDTDRATSRLGLF